MYTVLIFKFLMKWADTKLKRLIVVLPFFVSIISAIVIQIAYKIDTITGLLAFYSITIMVYFFVIFCEACIWWVIGKRWII